MPDNRLMYDNALITDIDECISNPCTYGSTCIDGIGVYQCICPAGRTGAKCQSG